MANMLPTKHLSVREIATMIFKPLAFFTKMARDRGDMAAFRIGKQTIVLLSDPALIYEVLVQNASNCTKGHVLEIFKGLVGEGLLTSEGEAHRRQRKTFQRVLNYQWVASQGPVITQETLRSQEEWREGETRDIGKEMSSLALRLAGKSFCNFELSEHSNTIQESLTDAVRLLHWLAVPFSGRFFEALGFHSRRLSKLKDRLHGLIDEMISLRRNHPHDYEDILSLLLFPPDGESPLPDALIKDEVLTMLLAGYETTANALTWTWYLLSQNPEAERKLHQELEDILKGHIPEVSHLPYLKYTKWVFSESLRLYPPAWAIGRTVIKDFKLNGQTIRSGSMIMISQFVLHRDPRWFTEPERFNPERWASQMKGFHAKTCYMPFGSGPRTCIGESFARTEGVLVLATLASRWRFRLAPGHRVAPQPLLTLRPRHGMQVFFRRSEVPGLS